MGETALPRRAREAGLDGLDHARGAIADHQKRIAEAARPEVLEEGGDRLEVFPRSRHQSQEDLLAVTADPPCRQHRFPTLPRTEPLRDPVHKQIRDVMFGQVLARKLLVVRPKPLPQLRHRTLRQQQTTLLRAKRILDVAHAQTARQHLNRKMLQRLRPTLQMPPDLRTKRSLPTRNLRRRIRDLSFRRPQPTLARPVAITTRRRHAALGILPAQSIPRFRLQRLFHKPTRRKTNQFATTVRNLQSTRHQILQRPAGPMRPRYPSRQGVCPPLVDAEQSAVFHLLQQHRVHAPTKHPAILRLHRSPVVDPWRKTVGGSLPRYAQCGCPFCCIAASSAFQLPDAEGTVAGGLKNAEAVELAQPAGCVAADQQGLMVGAGTRQRTQSHGIT